MTARGALSLIASVLCGFAVIWIGTEGFSAFTSEGARRLDIARQPRALPQVLLESHDGRSATLASFRGKVLVLDFIYTRCPTLCVSLGSSFERLREQVHRAGLGDRMMLMSISFDIANDGPGELADYASRFGGPDEAWKFVRPSSQPELAQLLRTAEVIVIPDDIGGFVHNAAILVVDRDGRLVSILDSDAVPEALALARRLM